MAFTYDIATTLGKVRSAIGDVDADDVLLQDAEIQEVIDRITEVPQAAIECINLILARLARKIARSAPGQNSSQQQKFEHYERLKGSLAKQAIGRNVKAYAGQIDKDRNDAAWDDESYEKPDFSVGMDDLPSRRGQNADEPEDR